MSDFHRLATIRRNRANASCEFVVSRVNKGGSLSRMRGQAVHCRTEAEALAYVARVRSLNPDSTLGFAINGKHV